jgi:hypothetical protein
VRPGDRDGQLGPVRGLGRQLVRGAKVLEAGRSVDQRLQQPELAQHVQPGRALGRFRERAAQVGDSALGGPAGGRRPGRAGEHLDAAGVAPARRQQQVRPDLLGRPAAQPQQPGGPLVRQRALRARHRPVDRVADQRVHEPDRLLVPQDLRPGEVGEGGRGGDLVEVGHLGDRGQVRPLAEHRDRTGDRGRLGRQPAQPGQHHAGDRPGAAGHHPVGVRGVRSDPVGLQRPQQLAEQQRVARGRRVAGGEEQLGGFAEPAADQLGGALPGQRAGPDHRGGRVEQDLGEQVVVLVPLAGTQCGEQQQRQPVQPAGQVDDEPQRGGVAPLQVVDGQHQRPLGGEPGGQPVEPVQHRERALGRLVQHVEHPAGAGRRPGQQPLPPLRVDQHRLEQLPDGAEPEGPFELAAPGTEHGQVLLGGQPAGLGQQPGLADARRPLDEQQLRGAGGEVGDRVPDDVQLVVAVDQVGRGRGGRRRRQRRRGRGDSRGQRRRLGQHLGLQRAQRRPGVDAELGREQRARSPERGERVRLPVRPVQREHEQPPPLLPQRLVRDQRLQLRHEQRGLAAVEPGGEQPLPGDGAQLGQPGDLGLGPRLAGILAQRRAAPEPERLGEQLGRPLRLTCGGGGRGVADQLLEQPGVDRVRRQPEGVAGAGAGDDPAARARRAVRLQPPAQVGHVRLDGAAGVAGKIDAPQAIRDALRGHDLAAGEDQHCEDSTLTATTEVDLGVAVAGVEPAEDPEPEPVPPCQPHLPRCPPARR